jgi:hypothetical protein
MPISRPSFFHFRSIFKGLGRFSSFFEVDFPFFLFFSILRYGILANRTRGCTIAHRQQELKPRNWAPKVTVFYFVYLGLKPLVSLGRIIFERSQLLLTALVGPTSSTHHSSARGGGLDTLFPSFLPLFWVAKCLNSPPKS